MEGRYLQSGLGEEIEDAYDMLALYKRCDDGKLVTIENFEVLASYNWATGFQVPTIIVPGAPNVWTPQPLPKEYPTDTWNYNDEIKARFPQSPLEPLIRALNMINPEFDLSKVNIVTDRCNLIKLMSWITWPVKRRRNLNDFRIDGEVAGNTVLFTRRTYQTEEDATIGNDFKGYGREFKKANTKFVDGCEGSTGHQRIVAYNLGELKLVVRFGVDGCFSLKPDPKYKTTKASGQESLSPALELALRDMNIHSDKPVPFDETGNCTLHYLKAGVLVDQSEILELNVRSERKTSGSNEVWRQLYVSQIPNIIVAKHYPKTGKFFELQLHSTTKIERNLELLPMIRNEDFDTGTVINKLKNILKLMMILVLQHGRESGLAFFHQGGQLRAFTRDLSNDQCTVVDSSLLDLFLPDRAEMEREREQEKTKD